MADPKHGIEQIEIQNLPETPSGSDAKSLDIGGEDRRVAEKKLLRRIDKRLMPLMMLICETHSSRSCKHNTKQSFRCSQLP